MAANDITTVVINQISTLLFFINESGEDEN